LKLGLERITFKKGASSDFILLYWRRKMAQSFLRGIFLKIRSKSPSRKL